MKTSDLPDWNAYTVEELEEALEGLDRERYPEREAVIRKLLQQRQNQGPQNRSGGGSRSDLPRWEHYNLAELRQALDGLDRQAYPDREQRLQELIQERENSSGEKPAASTGDAQDDAD